MSDLTLHGGRKVFELIVAHFLSDGKVLLPHVGPLARGIQRLIQGGRLRDSARLQSLEL